MQRNLVIAFFCANLRDGHLKFECSVLHSNVDFYFKFDEYSKFEFFYNPIVYTNRNVIKTYIHISIDLYFNI